MASLPTPPRSASPSSPRIDAAKLECQPRLHRRRIRSVMMRAGTSKGLFFRQEDLPEDRELWHEIITTAMGSPDSYLKQLNGMGGGASTQSKVAVVGPSSDPRADVDYTFIQGGPRYNGAKIQYPLTEDLWTFPVIVAIWRVGLDRLQWSKSTILQS